MTKCQRPQINSEHALSADCANLCGAKCMINWVSPNTKIHRMDQNGPKWPSFSVFQHIRAQ